jgi:hypothetical protein
MKTDIAYGYAWEIKVGSRWELCRWMAPDTNALQKGEKPSPEARMVPVKMMRRKP